MRINKNNLAAAFSFAAILATVMSFGYIAYQKDQERQLAEAAFNREVECLAVTAYWEAKRGNLEDQIAIIQNVLNRTEEAGRPETACGVVNEVRTSAQTGKKVAMYSYIFDSRPHPSTQKRSDYWETAQSLARTILADWYDNGSEFTVFKKERERVRGTVNYHATYVQPEWAVKGVKNCEFRPLGQVGAHLHYANLRETDPIGFLGCQAMKEFAAKKVKKAKKDASKRVLLASR